MNAIFFHRAAIFQIAIHVFVRVLFSTREYVVGTVAHSFSVIRLRLVQDREVPAE